MYSLTVFKSIFDNKTDTRVDFETFEQFEKSLYHLSTLNGYKAKRGEHNVKSSPLISPAVYKADTTRANANVIEWAQWAALDVDNHTFNGDLQDELHRLYPSYYFICYSTASSTKDNPKFRLVFPLTRTVKSNEIRHFWFALNTEFGLVGDTQTKDLSRMYYVPAQYPNAFNFIFTHRAAGYLNVDDLLVKHKYEEKTNSHNFFDRLPEELQKEVIKHRQYKLNENKKDTNWSSYKDCPFVNQNLISEYKRISRIDGSGRYSMIYKIMTSIACNAIKKKYPINEYEIAELILQLDRDTANRYQKRPLNVEAGRAIEFAYKNALINT
jgi:hypothetical protein